MKHTRAYSLVSLGLALAFSQGSTLAIAADSPGPNSPTPTSGDTGASSTSARDRHDTVRSNEARVNTVGRGIDPSATQLSRADRRFIEKTAKNGLAELRIARLAVERSADPRVRAFAQQLVSDHEKANSELSELAGRKGVSFPQDDNDRNFKALSDKSGADFDKTFVGRMVDEHENDIELFEKASRKSDDVEVAAFASKQLPLLQEHQRVARDLETTIRR